MILAIRNAASDRCQRGNERLTTAKKTLIMERMLSSLHPDCRRTMDAKQLFICGNRDDFFAVDVIRNAADFRSNV